MRYSLQCLAVTLLLGGCTALNDSVSVDWEHGARRGTITQLFDASVPSDQLPACLAMFSATQIASHRYVRLQYRHRRHNFPEVGELPSGVDAKLGDQVEFFPKNCDAGTLSTITRRLPPA